MVPPGPGPQSEEQRELRLRVPAHDRYLDLARSAVMGAAARNGSRGAVVERLGDEVGQAFEKLMKPGIEVILTVDVGPDAVEVRLHGHPDDAYGPIAVRAQR